jgi:DNA-directed RNA polymerase specialized sigma subunit
VPPLTRSEASLDSRTVGASIRAHRAATVGERIIAHLTFARAVAARSIDPRCRGADREDLISCGVLGLVDTRPGFFRPAERGASAGTR